MFWVCDQERLLEDGSIENISLPAREGTREDSMEPLGVEVPRPRGGGVGQ